MTAAEHPELDGLLRQVLIERKTYAIPKPDIVLYGCRPLVPFRGWPADQFHAFEVLPGDASSIKEPAINWPKVMNPGPNQIVCPACKGNVQATPGDNRGDGRIVRYCEACGGMGEPYEARAAIRRDLHEARVLAENARGMAQQAADEASHDGLSLSELDRRRIWNGYLRGCRLADIPEDDVRFTSAAKLGRDFLRRIGQCPDYDIVLDTRGNVLGRYSEGWTQPPAPEHEG